MSSELKSFPAFFFLLYFLGFRSRSARASSSRRYSATQCDGVADMARVSRRTLSTGCWVRSYSSGMGWSCFYEAAKGWAKVWWGGKFGWGSKGVHPGLGGGWAVPGILSILFGNNLYRWPATRRGGEPGKAPGESVLRKTFICLTMPWCSSK